MIVSQSLDSRVESPILVQPNGVLRNDQAIPGVSDARPFASERIHRVLHSMSRSPARPAPRPEALPLSVREQEVLDLVADGMTNRAVASRLKISERTVREHIARIFLKLRVESRVEAAVIATEWRLARQYNLNTN